MTLRRKFLTLLLVLTLTAAMTLNASAYFSDVSDDDWFYSAVTALSERGIIGGFPDGGFRPNEALTAGQFFKMVYISAIGTPLDESGISWAEAYYDALAEMGLIKPSETYAETLDEPISRCDTARVTARYIEKIHGETADEPDEIGPLISDYNEIPERYRSGVSISYSSGIMGGYGDGSFRGEAYLTRAEAAVIIERLTDTSKRLTVSTETGTVTPVSSAPVSDDFFNNAMFLGDSLTHGLSLSGGLDTPDYYYSTGISVFGINSSTLDTPSGSEYTLNDAMSRRDYEKVYILLGINELGYASGSYYEAYASLIDTVKTALPNTEIYIQSVLPVSKAKDSEGTFTKNAVLAFNEVLQRLASEKQVRYLDIHSELADSSGFLPASATWDGIHLNSSYYVKWADYLRANP